MLKYVNNIKEITLKVRVDCEGGTKDVEVPLVEWSHNDGAILRTLEKYTNDTSFRYEVIGAGNGWGELADYALDFWNEEFKMLADVAKSLFSIDRWNAYCAYVATYEQGYAISERKFNSVYIASFGALEEFTGEHRIIKNPNGGAFLFKM